MAVDNLTKLESLDVPSILGVIKTRYQKGEIYTKCGEIIIAVNPFRDLGIYTDYHHELYKHEYWSKTLKPHIFYTAECALQNMLESRTNQAIIVSGESGAGKTESTKYMLRHLMYSSMGNKDSPLQKKIIHVNPLLEAFGNAQTAMNKNSSRFGKYTEVCFNGEGRVTGAIIRDYMLEKSRLVHQSPGEGNFHVFYAFFAGADLKQYELEKLINYRILKNTDIHLIKDIYRFKNFYDQINGIFRTLNFTDEDINTVERILAAIVHLTQIEFNEEHTGASLHSPCALASVAMLLYLDAEQLEKALLTKTLKMPDETVETPKNKHQADEGRDSLAKALYERLFGWIVRKINEGIMPVKKEGCTIGILDISGFENLKRNSFEQLCINIINERLQNYLNKHIFECEKQLYLAEGVDLDAGGIDFQDNGDIIAMLTKPPCCLLSIINEESHLPETNYLSLTEKLNSLFGKYQHFTADEGASGRFCIHHFAGEVWYNTYSFLEKNKDELNFDLVACLRDSSDDFISDLFTVRKGPTGTISVTPFQFRPSRKFTLENSLTHGRRSNKSHRVPKVQKTRHEKTVIGFLKASLDSLLQKLDESEPHFVRCIKPNYYHRPDAFHEEKVKEQLINSGVAEAAKIRKLGFPYRLTFKEFIDRYFPLTIFMKSQTDEKRKVYDMLRYLNISQKEFRLGTHKVFLKQPAHFFMGKCLKICKTYSAIKIQRFWRVQKLRRQTMMQHIQPSLRRRTLGKKSVRINLQDELCDSYMSEGALPLDDITAPLGLITENHKPPSKYKKKTKKKKKQEVEPVTNEEDNEEDDMPWDIFQSVADEPDTSTLQNTNLIKLIKVLFYIFLFLIVLGTAVTQKLSFFALIQQTESAKDKVKDQFYTLMLIAICIPYGLTVLISMGKVLFGSKKKVSFKTAMKVLLIESVHSICLSSLVFDIFPKLEIVPGILMMNSVALIPSLLRALFPASGLNEPPRNENDILRGQIPNSRGCKKVTVKILNVMTIIIQLACIIIFTIFEKKLLWYRKVECFLTFAFVSIQWWENFYDGCNMMPKFNQTLMGIKYELQYVRHFMNMIAYTWKIMVTILCAYLLGNHKFNVSFENKNFDEDIIRYLPIILLCLCSAFGYYFAYLACKLCMQEVAFAVPLLLATPVTILITMLPCWFGLEINKDNPFSYLNNCWWSFSMNNIVVIIIGCTLYISIFWIVRHIFKSEQSRLMRRELLFLNPYYCSIFYEQGISMSRRCHNYTIQCSPNEDKFSYKLEKNTDSDKIQSEGLKGKKYYPKVYACATMWHETPNEMMQILKSIFRMSIEQQVRKDMKELEKDDDGYFEFEAHIFFDDCMTLNDDEEVIVNKFVETFVSKVDEAASSVMKSPVKLEPPAKILTPYGGQLLWVLQSDVLLYVHLKDKNKIRHKKRWSQVMYMYYLLGHRLTKICADNVVKKTLDISHANDVFELVMDDVNKTAENTFLLALDGDVDFNPDAVKLLIDLMLKNNKVGAACGRIHPIGSGPMVWFQIFEYAVGHWLQKATEHVLGCVLCSPGCFSLFRGSALMDTNVMRQYTILPTEPKHYLQYDQGEDRWLCTLLLQQGYRVDYCAAADAYTYAPDTFSEFFNQRRRWMPSTIANIMDLLASYKTTVLKNDNISTLYILYQLALMVSTMIGPATVMMMIASAITSVFKVDIPLAYVLVLIPNAIYTILCFYSSSKTQLNVACLLTAIYSFIMMAVLVGVVIQAAKDSLFNPGVVIITAMVILFLFTAMLHPQEKSCLLPGVLYFLCIPSGYLLLVIYSLCNMHVVSWGTREVKAKLTKKQMEIAKKEEEMAAKKKSEKSFFSKLFNFPAIVELSEIFKASQMKKENDVLRALDIINTNISKLLSDKHLEAERFLINSQNQEIQTDSLEKYNEEPEDDDSDEVQETEEAKDESAIPIWASGLGKGIIVDLNDEEKKFWHGIIKKYLFPLNRDKDEEKKAQEDLMLFRTDMCFAMIMVNLLWMAINFMFQYSKPSQIKIDNMEVELFSFVFLLFFTLLFALQFFGMLMHRWGTFLHIISYTNIRNPFRKKQTNDSNLNKECCRNIIRKLRYEPVPDYEDRAEIKQGQKEFEERVEKHIQNTARKMQEEKNIEKNIETKKIGCVLKKSIRRQNTTTGLTRKVAAPARRPESRYERKEKPVPIGSRRREQRRNFQLVSRKNLRKDVDRLLRQSRVGYTPENMGERDANENLWKYLKCEPGFITMRALISGAK